MLSAVYGSSSAQNRHKLFPSHIRGALGVCEAMYSSIAVAYAGAMGSTMLLAQLWRGGSFGGGYRGLWCVGKRWPHTQRRALLTWDGDVG